MKEIEKYIQFGIDNGFKTIDVLGNIASIFNEKGIKIKGDTMYIVESAGTFCYPIIELITSKKFIEAIARGIEKKLKNNLETYIYINDNMWDGHRFVNYTFDKTDLSEDICYGQAISIRDNNLIQYINNLLDND